MSIIAPDGDIAQLVERTDRTREVRGSNPLISNFLEKAVQRQKIWPIPAEIALSVVILTARAISSGG
jgi:hypothetical protein